MNTPSWWRAPWGGGPVASPGTVALALSVIVVAWGLSWLLRRVLARIVEARGIGAGVGYSLGRLLHYALLVLALILAIQTLGIDLTSLTLLAGALGVGIGFGLQSVAGNFIAGVTLLFERPIRPGDRISVGTLDADAVGTVNGYVREIGLRATTVVTPDNIVLVIPNSELTSHTVVNWSLGDPRIRTRLSIDVDTDSDLDLVRRVVERVAREHPETLRDPPPEVRLVATKDSALEIQLLVWLPVPRQRGRVESELRFALVREFRKEGIVIPFPRREVRIAPRARLAGGSPGGAPPSP